MCNNACFVFVKHMHMDKQTNQMSLNTCLNLIAQGAVNISEGHTVIESGSPIHRAMYELLDHYNRLSRALVQEGVHVPIVPSRAYPKNNKA